MPEDIYSIVMLLFAIGLVVVMAFATTYIIGKKSNSIMRNPGIKVLERASVGFQINIYVLLINGKVYILSIQNKSTQLLDVIDAKEWFEKKQEFSLEALQTGAPLENSMDSISAYLKRYVKMPNRKKGDDL